MAADSVKLGAKASRRAPTGFALFAAIIAVAVVAVLASVVLVTLSGDNDQNRIERAADVLSRLASAMDTVRTTTGASFTGNVGKGPSKLTQLNTPLVAGDQDCKPANFATTPIGNWRGPYFYAPIPTTGYRITPGFTANNVLVSAASFADIAIKMDGVALADAKALELFVEKTSAGAGPKVTFALTDPTSVYYHIISTSGTFC